MVLVLIIVIYISLYDNKGASVVAQMVKNPLVNAGDSGLILGLGRPPEEGKGSPPQYSCLENPVDREPGGLQSVGSPKSQTRLSD